MTYSLSHEEIQKIRDLARLLDSGVDSFGGEDGEPAITIRKKDQAEVVRLVWSIQTFIS